MSAGTPPGGGQPLSGLPHPTYRADIDGLRAVAILAVVAFHAFPEVVGGGFVGVDVFFVISGFLISGIILGGLRQGTFSFRTFFARRIRRLFPALVPLLAACLLWGWVALFADDYAQLGKHVAGGAGFVANFVLWSESGYFDSAADRKPLLHLWSLGIEEQFYVAWPLTLYAAWRLRLHLLPVIGLLLGASFLFNAIEVRGDAVAAFYSPATRGWELLMGGALAFATVNGLPAFLARLPDGSPAARAFVCHAASIAGLILIAFPALAFDATTSFPGWRAAFPTAGALLLIAAGTDAWVNRHVLASQAMVWIGLISYPLYLWHWPLLSFATVAQSGTPPAAWRGALVALSVLLAWATYAFVETPFRFRWRGPAPVTVLCAALVLVFAAGFVTYRAEGFVERPLNRSDEAHFLQYYDRLHKRGLRDAYRSGCDFMDWTSGANRTAIDPDCTAPGARGTVLLWGDSHAQALSHGLRAAMPDGFRLAQVTTSACPPRLVEPDPAALGGRCVTSGAYAAATIRFLEPDLVILAQLFGHEDTDWIALAGEIRAMGARQVILVGPVPQWDPSLPLVIVRHYWRSSFERVSRGLRPYVLRTDRLLRERLERATEVQYVSVIGELCDSDGCLATVPDTDGQLVAVDSGHLSPQGSVFVVHRTLRAHLPR